MSKRTKFFIGHLSLSICIGLIVLSLVFGAWYPSPLAKALGVTHIFLMLLAIDVIIGPLLTLLVYKEGKKTLKMDLAVIGLLQLSALGYGLYNIEQGRPVWLAFQNTQFELVRHNDVDDSNIEKAEPQYRHVPWFNPVFVSVKEGKTQEEKNRLLFLEMETGVPAAYRPEYYQPIEKAFVELLGKARNLSELNKFNTQEDVNRLLAAYPTVKAWLPLRIMMGTDMVVFIDEKGTVLDIVDLRPWKMPE